MKKDHSQFYKNGGGNGETMNSTWWQVILTKKQIKLKTGRKKKTQKKQSKVLPINEDALVNLSIDPGSKSVSCMIGLTLRVINNLMTDNFFQDTPTLLRCL